MSAYPIGDGYVTGGASGCLGPRLFYCMALTENEYRFALEYCSNHNSAIQAYIRAYSTPEKKVSYSVAKTEAYELLKKPGVKAEIKAIRDANARACNISARKVLRELALIAFSDKEELFEMDPHSGLPKPRRWADIKPTAKRAIQSIKIKKRVLRKPTEETPYLEEIEEVEFKYCDKMRALDKLADHLGLTKESDAVKKLLELLGKTAEGDTEGDASGGDASGDAPGG